MKKCNSSHRAAGLSAAKNFFTKNLLQKILLIVFCLALFWFLFWCRDTITVEAIVNFTPENQLWAALMLLLLFAVKSLVVVVYCGILYTASGIMFPGPLALLINLVGTFIMISIPYYIGKRLGSGAIDALVKKHPKLAILSAPISQNEFLAAFFLRVVGCFPADLLGMYLSMTGMHYSSYVFGSLLGMLSSIVPFTLLGVHLDDMTSPGFIISAAIAVALMVGSVIAYVIWQHRRRKEQQGHAVD